MKIFFSILFLGLIVSCSDDGIQESFYKNGQSEGKGNIINGQQEGIWEFFYENG